MKKRFKRVFLDYASTTPVDGKVFKKMKPYFHKNFGNPSASYNEGILANQAISKARQDIATICGVKDHEVIFTGSGTEANNLLFFGSIKAAATEDHLKEKWANNQLEIMVSEIEHPSVIEPVKNLEKENKATINFLEVREDGIINLDLLSKSLNENTFLISVILANNEIGTINPIREISSIVKKYKNKLGRSFDEPPYIHTDASQAPNFLDIHMDRLGVHAMTIDSSKIYGPKGAGCLIKKSYVPLSSIMYGGGQESNLRPGTENVPQIIGMSEALQIAQKQKDDFSKKMKNLQNYFISQIKNKFPVAKINGSIKNRLPNNVNFCIEGLNSEFAVIQLDELGVACSAATSCKGLSEDFSSYVVDSLYKTQEKNGASKCGQSSLRFTFGRGTTKRDIDFAIKALSDII